VNDDEPGPELLVLRLSSLSPKYVLSALVTLIGCDALPHGGFDPGDRVDVFVPAPATTLVRATYSGLTQATRLVVRDRDTWLQTWQRIHANQSPIPLVVQPDFGEEVAIVVALGSRPAGGYDIVVDSVTRHERGAVVWVRTVTPDASCFVTGALVQPVHAVRAPRFDGAIRYHLSEDVLACS
jgi:hypothetical protein